MGNIQGTGSFNSSKSNDTTDSVANRRKQTDIEKTLEREKQKFGDLLQLYLYHINLAILEHSFKLKNEEMLLKINADLITQATDIKKKEERHSAQMRDFKYFLKKSNYIKTVNIIMFYIALLCVLTLTILIGYSIYIY